MGIDMLKTIIYGCFLVLFAFVCFAMQNLWTTSRLSNYKYINTLGYVAEEFSIVDKTNKNIIRANTIIQKLVGSKGLSKKEIKALEAELIDLHKHQNELIELLSKFNEATVYNRGLSIQLLKAIETKTDNTLSSFHSLSYQRS